MSVRITVSGVTELSQEIWLFELPPHQVRHFGSGIKSVGKRSVLLLNACNFDPETLQLSFEIDEATALNVGTSSAAIGIASNVNRDNDEETVERADLAGPGDREFLRLTRSELTKDVADAAKQMLAAVRERSPGDLKRGQSRNFSETPDNFWYVIVQPRINELSLTVRGSVSHFESIAGLEIKDDRGNTRFKVRSVEDVPLAVKLIFHAIRKR